MGDGNTFWLILLAVLVLLSGFFSAAETALTTVNLHRLRALTEEEGRKAKRARKVLLLREKGDQLLSTVLICNNVVNILASAIATMIFTRMFGNRAVGFVTGGLTLVILIFGELTPKTLATLYNLKLSLFFGPVILFLMRILTPLIWLLRGISRGIFRIFGIDPDVNPNQMTEEELRQVVNASSDEGVIEADEKEMITNVVDFKDAVAKDVMIPRADMVSVEDTITYEELLEVIRESNYSRLPVYREKREHVVGILYIKDLLRPENMTELHLSRMMRKPLYVYEYQRVSQVFKDMKQAAVSACIVLDEYGIAAGLITMEDLLEEIVGDIRDEYDADEEDWIRKIRDGVYDVDASVRLDDLNDALDLELESDNYDSVGGYVIELLDRLPKEGDRVENGSVSILVRAVEHNRVTRVEMKILEKKNPEEESGDEETGK